MTVNDLVSLGRFPHTNWIGKLTPEDIAVITDSIEKVGMTDFVSRNISELSDGERQRAMVARVLAQDTDLLIMDEPTAFLDIKSKYEIIHLLHELSRERGKTVIFSTHDLNVAMSESDKIWLILDDLFFEGAPEDLILEGAFDKLFSNSLVKFNNKDGNFTFRTLISGKVKVNGEGNMRIWTEKAINRAGFSVSGQDSDIEIDVFSYEGKNIWKVSANDTSKEFYKLYDLVNWLVSSR
jgi:iron complex transport system ATP-binding protein